MTTYRQFKNVPPMTSLRALVEVQSILMPAREGEPAKVQSLVPVGTEVRDVSRLC